MRARELVGGDVVRGFAHPAQTNDPTASREEWGFSAPGALPMLHAAFHQPETMPAPSPGALCVTATAPAGDARRILVIEDDRGYRELVQEWLRLEYGPDLECQVFGSLEEARTRLFEGWADCVLLDLTLPDAQGLEAVIGAGKAAPQVPLVVLSGHDDEALALRAVKSGAQDYLIKCRADGAQISRSIRHAIERKRGELEMTHPALHDPLTGVPNRVLFLDRLSLALHRSERRDSYAAVLFVDLDRFTIVNDSLGHEAGDLVLQAVAARLTKALRPGDTLARLGGDEFAVLCEEVGSARDAMVVAERLLAALKNPFVLAEGEIFMSASIGAALAEGGEHTPETLLRDADAAMYRAKQTGSTAELFDERLRAEAKARIELEADLHLALEREELLLFYQPLVSIEFGQMISVEALLRWQRPGALLEHKDFLAVAEETGMIVPIGEWVLTEACRQAQQWQTINADGSPVSSPSMSRRAKCCTPA